MTAAERSLIEKLREELHGYHVEVKEIATRFEIAQNELTHTTSNVVELQSAVAELQYSKKTMLFAIRGAWALLTALVASGAAWLFTKL
jgi:chromosome segregation ATPase